MLPAYQFIDQIDKTMKVVLRRKINTVLVLGFD